MRERGRVHVRRSHESRAERIRKEKELKPLDRDLRRGEGILLLLSTAHLFYPLYIHIYIKVYVCVCVIFFLT